MLANAMFLAIISVVLEMFLVTKQPVVRHFFTKHELLGLVFSFGLSVALGTIFGAAGLIAMMGGICSTVITTIIYKSHALKLVDQYKANKDMVSAKINSTKITVIKVIKFWWAFITAPVRFIVWCKRWIDKTGADIRVSYANMKKVLHRG